MSFPAPSLTLPVRQFGLWLAVAVLAATLTVVPIPRVGDVTIARASHEQKCTTTYVTRTYTTPYHTTYTKKVSTTTCTPLKHAKGATEDMLITLAVGIGCGTFAIATGFWGGLICGVAMEGARQIAKNDGK